MAFKAQFVSGNPVMIKEITTGTAIESGDVVVKANKVLICHTAIPINSVGALASEGGTYSVDKATTAVFAIGAEAYWDATNQRADPSSASGANKFIGYTEFAAGNPSSKVRIVHATP